MAPSVMLAVTLAHLLISCTCGLMDNTAPESCSATQLLTVNGCPVFVHDATGAKDFEVEPLMCVTQSLSNLFPQYDPLTQQIFVSVPVKIRDEAMRAEIDNQLQHLSPNSVNFANVSKMSISMDVSSKHVLMFLWSPDEPVAYLTLGCTKDPKDCKQFFLNLNVSIFDAINWVTAKATIKMGSKQTELNYKLMVQNQNIFNPQFYGSNFECRSNCDDLQFLQTVSAGKCIARVYQRKYSANFYIEPLLCPNSSVANELIMYDYSRDMHYLELDVVLQDGVTLNAVQNKLAPLSVVNISYMQLSQVNIVLSSFLSRRFDIGPLMVSRDWSSGQMRVYCKTEDDCKFLRSNIIVNPLSFWSHVNFELISHIPNKCIVKSTQFIHNIRLTDVYDIWQSSKKHQEVLVAAILGLKYQTKTVDGKKFVIIQQRMNNSISFARNWSEYEAGFGDATNFWIGLSTIHSLSINGVTLRVEMKLKNGSELHQEYEGFNVQGASTNYTMTCGGLIGSRSSDSYDAMKYINGMQFSTMDRDNDKHSVSCSNIYSGSGGWWYKDCSYCLPNHLYDSVYIWHFSKIGWQPLTEIRLMLQI